MPHLPSRLTFADHPVVFVEWNSILPMAPTDLPEAADLIRAEEEGSREEPHVRLCSEEQWEALSQSLLLDHRGQEWLVPSAVGPVGPMGPVTPAWNLVWGGFSGTMWARPPGQAWGCHRQGSGSREPSDQQSETSVPIIEVLWGHRAWTWHVSPACLAWQELPSPGWLWG